MCQVSYTKRVNPVGANFLNKLWNHISFPLPIISRQNSSFFSILDLQIMIFKNERSKSPSPFSGVKMCPIHTNSCESEFAITFSMSLWAISKIYTWCICCMDLQLWNWQIRIASLNLRPYFWWVRHLFIMSKKLNLESINNS